MLTGGGGQDDGGILDNAMSRASTPEAHDVPPNLSALPPGRLGRSNTGRRPPPAKRARIAAATTGLPYVTEARTAAASARMNMAAPLSPTRRRGLRPRARRCRRPALDAAVEAERATGGRGEGAGAQARARVVGRLAPSSLWAVVRCGGGGGELQMGVFDGAKYGRKTCVHPHCLKPLTPRPFPEPARRAASTTWSPCMPCRPWRWRRASG